MPLTLTLARARTLTEPKRVARQVEVAMSLTPKVFAPGEVAPKGYLYVINRGLALYGARVLTAGKVWHHTPQPT